MGLKIAMVTSWKVKCGIFTYTENLVHALADLDVESYIVRLPRFGQKTSEMLQNIVDSIPVDKVDIIHVQEEYGLYQNLEGGFFGGLKRLGKPIIVTMHAVANWDIDQVVASTSDKVIVHNEFCARHFGFPSVIIPHGTKPSDTVSAEEAKRSFGIDPRIQVIGIFGFLSNYKGFEVALQALEKLPNVAMLVTGGWHAIGETTYITRLRQEALSRFPGRIQFLGFVPDERLPTVFGAQDILLFCHRYATESGALLTALSYGKACLTSRLPPFVEKEKMGVLQTYRSVPDLVRKLKKLLKNKDLKRKYEEAAHKFAISTSWDKIAQAHIKLYQKVLDEHAR